MAVQLLFLLSYYHFPKMSTIMTKYTKKTNDYWIKGFLVSTTESQQLLEWFHHKPVAAPCCEEKKPRKRHKIHKSVKFTGIRSLKSTIFFQFYYSASIEKWIMDWQGRWMDVHVVNPVCWRGFALPDDGSG